jgi:PAS domain S-box-containing protein
MFEITKKNKKRNTPSRELELYQAIADLSKALISSLSMDDISSLVLERAKHLTESKSGYVGYIDPQTRHLVVPTLTRDLWESCQVKGKSIVFKEFGGLWGWVLENRKSILTNNAKTDPRANGVPAGHVPIHRFLSTPAVINNTLVGQVAVANSYRNYDARDLELIEHLATLYAIAIERKRSETNYREIFNVANDAILVHNIDTAELLDVNYKFCEMFGYTLEESRNLKVEKLYSNVPPYTKEIGWQNFIKAKENIDALPPIFEWLAKDKAGRVFWIEVSIRKGVIGGKDSVLSIVRDISKRKKMEESLKTSERDLRILSSKLLSVQEKEKKRIARDLHDSIGQSLTAVKIEVENILKNSDQKNAREVVEPLKGIIPKIQGIIGEVRRVTMDLRPATLDDLGILATISYFCREFQKVFPNIRIEQQINIQENEVPNPLKITLFRVIQETFNNIAKHSQADLILLSFLKKGFAIELIIEDNGKGFEIGRELTGVSPKRGLGLVSIKERVDFSRGTVSITSTKGVGTIVRASWPTQAIVDVEQQPFLY